jgi:ParB-like nuclease domain
MRPDLRVETAPLAALAPYTENARTHSEAQVAQIAASIAEFGFVNPVLVDTAGALIAGHGRVMAARRLGLACVPAIRLGHLLQDIARVIARRTITEPLANAASSALSGMSFDSMFSGVGNWVGGLFRAEGGPVGAGRPYIVGERGPEWFVPDRAGTVLPSGTSPFGGTTLHNSISIDARGADAGVEARLRLLAGQIARQASAMTLDAVRRGGAAYETALG